ncbi:MAG: hypothetical protein DWQ37_02960 [Planctomycetota bacterium]|nr:MAG: hypothetical protein DWQ37_02960 [Planctomycetota bacterium]
MYLGRAGAVADVLKEFQKTLREQVPIGLVVLDAHHRSDVWFEVIIQGDAYVRGADAIQFRSYVF